MIHRTANHRAFVILYAVLMVSIVLTVSLSLLNITYRQIIITNTAADSRLAEHVALSTIRCIKYWDNLSPVADDPNGDIDGISSDYYPFGKIVGASWQVDSDAPVRCGGETVANLGAGPNYSFQITYDDELDSLDNVTCAKVRVTKDATRPLKEKTAIVVSGYNLPCNSPGTRLVERTFSEYY